MWIEKYLSLPFSLSRKLLHLFASQAMCILTQQLFQPYLTCFCCDMQASDPLCQFMSSDVRKSEKEAR